MQKIILLFIILLPFISCESSENRGCSYNGHTLYTGPKGGCYYLSSGGNKEYVDKSHCSSCN